MMSLPPQYSAAADLEVALGPPEEDTTPFSFAEVVRLDHESTFPAAQVDALDEWGLSGYYVPAAVGGDLRNCEELLALVRVMARRDLTTAIGHAKTFLGSIAVWVAGTETQQRRLAKLILAGTAVSLGLTEREHGADLLASDVSVRQGERGELLLSGEKWLINNATRGGVIVVFARSASGGGVRGMSLHVVEKAQLPAGSFSTLPKIRTHGIRGADISGIRFHDAALPAASIIGRPGTGLGTLLATLHISRTMCASLSLGAADTALRATVDFARHRRLYGTTVLELPHARRTLARAFADLLGADAATVAATRAIQAAPQQLSIWSAVTKTLVPAAMEQAVRDLAVVLGARFYLSENHWSGIFEKIVRDIALVPLFDGSSVVNLHTIVRQLKALLAEHAHDPSAEERLALTCDLHQDLPPLDLSAALALTSGGSDDVTGSWPHLRAQLATVSEPLATVTAAADTAWQSLVEGVAALAPTPSYAEPAAAFDLAWRYCQLRAAMTAGAVWLANRDALGPFFADPTWLSVSMARLVGAEERLDVAWVDHMIAELVHRADAGLMLSLVPVPLARRTNSVTLH